MFDDDDEVQEEVMAWFYDSGIQKHLRIIL